MAPAACPMPSPTMAYLVGLVLSLCLSLVRGQSGEVAGDIACIAQHTSNWGDHMAELNIQVSQCAKGYIEWTRPKGHLKVVFEDSWKQEFAVCVEQMDLSPWTAIRNMTHEIDNRIEPLRLPVGRPTCTNSQDGIIKICIRNPQLRVYRTSLYFYVIRA